MTRTAAAADAALPSNRRTFLGSLALASLASTDASTAGMLKPDAYLMALGAELDRLEIEIEPYRVAADAGDADEETILAYKIKADAQHDVMKKIAAARATTIEGFAIKARAVAYSYGPDFTAAELGLDQATSSRQIWSILDGLVKLAGSAVSA